MIKEIKDEGLCKKKVKREEKALNSSRTERELSERVRRKSLKVRSVHLGEKRETI